jgi:hypothetical protein
VLFLPRTSENQPRIVLERVGKLDVSKFSLTDLVKISYMLAEFEMMESDASVILGGIAIVDLEDMGFELISQ